MLDGSGSLVVWVVKPLQTGPSPRGGGLPQGVAPAPLLASSLITSSFIINMPNHQQQFFFFHQTQFPIQKGVEGVSVLLFNLGQKQSTRNSKKIMNLLIEKQDHQ